jgi:CO/xanthine dehydrogenase Mo-binding subunit
VRSYTAALLGLDPASIRVTASEIGGGFGGKTTVYLEPLAVALSQRCGRPVKMQMSREEVFRATGPGSATRITVKVGAHRDGVVAVDVLGQGAALLGLDEAARGLGNF